MTIRNHFRIALESGAITRYIETTAVDSSLIATFYSRDKVPIGVTFWLAGEDVTADVLADAAELRVGIRRYTGTGVALALSVLTLNAGVAEGILDLDTAEMASYMDALANQETSKSAYLEFEVTSADGTERLTGAQTEATLRCEVNIDGDEPPAAAATSAASAAASAAAAAGMTTALATHAALRAVVTAASAVTAGRLRTVVISSALEWWHFKAGTNADDDANFLRPDDYNASTNAFVWERVS
jgi:hypothetical protein